MSEKKMVLAVDDEPVNCSILEELLASEYDLHCVLSGEACLDFLQDRTPDLILMDVNMPGITGLEACRRLRQLADLAQTPVIFISALSSLEERLAGYEVGGDDYLGKPFDGEELQLKMDNMLSTKALLESQQKQTEEHKQASQDAMQTVFSALTNASEMGGILRLIQDSFAITHYQQLAQRVLQLLPQMGLRGSLFAWDIQNDQCASTDGAIRPLEKTVAEQARKRGRIFDFGKRTTMYNSGGITLLIKNMPIEDAEKYGRLKDHLAILVEGVDAKVKALLINEKLDRQSQKIQEMMVSTLQALRVVEDKQIQYQEEITDVMSHTVKAMENAFLHLGLTEEQEKFILDLMLNVENKVISTYKKSIALDAEFKNIAQNLQAVIAD